MCNRYTGACYGKRVHSETFNAFNRILMEETAVNLYERPGTVSVIERSLMVRSRVSRVKKRILTNIRTCSL